MFWVVVIDTIMSKVVEVLNSAHTPTFMTDNIQGGRTSSMRM